MDTWHTTCIVVDTAPVILRAYYYYTYNKVLHNIDTLHIKHYRVIIKDSLDIEYSSLFSALCETACIASQPPIRTSITRIRTALPCTNRFRPIRLAFF